ncbi:hypothetical protein [Desulfitobacterium hafniense]|uniref:hypothetical protein n=1 Tax=Desulfitobacterium hafniense TaxID=49338 RepID=UPI000382A337|nr:hypothetical protein [Desulfitobacterium hafniense]
MYTVGFVDNSFDLLPDYQTRLKRHGISLLFPEEKKSKEEILQWIFENNIRCLMVDHKLRPNFDFVGTDLVAYINSELPDLPCMILTSYTQESLNENLVIENMIEDRDSSLSSNSIVTFADKLKQAVDVFCKRIERHEEEYRLLIKKKKNGSITAQEEERAIYLYRLLRAYGELDEFPAELLRSEIEGKVDTIIGKLNDLLVDITSEKAGD